MARTKQGDGPNKMALVREAIGTLGAKAKPKAIHEHIKTTHNVEIPTAMISSYKSMIANAEKKKGKGKRGPGRPPKSESMGVTTSRSGGLSLEDVAAVKAMVGKFGAANLSDLIKLLSK